MTTDERAQSRAAELLAPHFEALASAQDRQELSAQLYRLCCETDRMLAAVNGRSEYVHTATTLIVISTRARWARREMGYGLLSADRAQQEITTVAALLRLEPDQQPRQVAA